MQEKTIFTIPFLRVRRRSMLPGITLRAFAFIAAACLEMTVSAQRKPETMFEHPGHLELRKELPHYLIGSGMHAAA